MSINSVKKYFKSVRSLPIVLGLSSMVIPSAIASSTSPAEIELGSHQAIATTSQSQLINSSIPPNAISLDFGDLFQGIIRYVQVANISDEQEVEIGRQINDMLLSQQYNLYENAQIQEYVDNLGQELVSNSDSRDIPYTFQVVESDAVNAFATPGGFVYVTTGLLEAADNQAQVASVLAHEIAHINQRHSVEALKQAAIAQGIAETANISTNTLAQIGYQLAIDLPRSRDFEYEADSFGLEILQQAGYPPMAFVNFLQKLEDNSPQPEFLRTHPTTSNRIEALAAEVQANQTASTKGLDATAYQNNVLSLL